MNRNELHSKLLNLAPTKMQGNDFLRNITLLFDEYLQLLSQLDESDRFDNWDETVSIITNYCDKIKEVITLYYKGMHANAYHVLAEQLETLPLVAINHEDAYYRMRKVEAGTRPTMQGMFHIPFNRRTIIRTERFSTPGLPCLYLSRTPYTCWKELGEPETDLTYIAVFKHKAAYKYLLLELPRLEMWNVPSTGLNNMRINLLYFPFIIASMVKNNYGNASFIPQYILPQMILQWVIESLYEDFDTSNKPIGIQYTSVHYNHKDEHNIACFSNLVIPAYYDGKGIYSSTLASWFTCTEPIEDNPHDISKFGDNNMANHYNTRMDMFEIEKRYPLHEIDTNLNMEME